MKKRFFVLQCCLVLVMSLLGGNVFPIVTSTSVGIHHGNYGCGIGHSDVVYVESTSPKPYSRHWLYTVAQNPHFELYKPVQENREYYIQLMRDHIKTLERKLADENFRVSGNKLVNGVMANVIGSAFIYIGGLGFYDSISQMRSESRSSFEMCAAGAMFTLFCGMGGFVGFQGCKQVVKAFKYKQGVIKRLKRDKKILAALENMQV